MIAKMKKLNVALVRLIQFVIFVFFTFVVISYFSIMIMIPLAVLDIFGDLFGLFGLNSLIGTALGLPVVAYLCNVVYKTPALSEMIVSTGIELVKTGKAKVDAFNEIAESL